MLEPQAGLAVVDFYGVNCYKKLNILIEWLGKGKKRRKNKFLKSYNDQSGLSFKNEIPRRPLEI